LRALEPAASRRLETTFTFGWEPRRARSRS
jgi:hypothetical protein